MASNFIFVCPFCGQKLECDESMENQTVCCPSCKQEIVPVRDVQPANRETPPRKNIEISESDEETSEKPSAGRRFFKRGIRSINDFVESNTRALSLKDRVFGYADSEGKFKTPLLANIFYFGGLISLAISLTVFAITLYFDLSDRENEYANRAPGYFVAVVVFADAFWNFGIAQILYCIGKSAFNSDKILESLTGKKK